MSKEHQPRLLSETATAAPLPPPFPSQAMGESQALERKATGKHDSFVDVDDSDEESKAVE